MDRRIFLKAVAAAALPCAAASASYGLFEASWVEVVRQRFALPRLPKAFDGMTVAFLADIHHGPFTNLDYVAGVVRTTLSLRPDLILLGGDYCLKDAKYIRPCFEVLAGLTAPMGVFGVLGNHDYWHGLEETREGFKSAKIGELTNRGVWVERGTDRFRLAGVDDLWMGKVDVTGALGDAKPDDACLLVSHNPDVAEKLRDPRVGLMLSGHTHGGQIVIPVVGSPWAPVKDMRYLHGLKAWGSRQIHVTSGVGSARGVRFNCPPELVMLELTGNTMT